MTRLEGRPLTAPLGDSKSIVWLEGDSEKARLVVLRGSRRTVRLERASLSGLAVAGDTAYVSAPESDGEKLLRLDLRTGRVETIARLTAKADEITQGEGSVVWRETRGGDLPGAPFVTAAEALTVLRTCDDRGRATTLAVLHTGSDSLDEVRFLGVTGSKVYWLERRQGVRTTTLVWRASLPQGEPEMVASEAGARSAALGGDKLAWTAPSREAAEPGTFSAVLERPLEAGPTRVVGDWVGTRAELAVSGEVIYAQERRRLWRFQGGLGDQQSLGPPIPSAVRSSIIGEDEYVIVRSRRGYTMVRRPLTWGARMRGLLP